MRAGISIDFAQKIRPKDLFTYFNDLSTLVMLKKNSIPALSVYNIIIANSMNKKFVHYKKFFVKCGTLKSLQTFV